MKHRQSCQVFSYSLPREPIACEFEVNTKVGLATAVDVVEQTQA